MSRYQIIARSGKALNFIAHELRRSMSRDKYEIISAGVAEELCRRLDEAGIREGPDYYIRKHISRHH